MLGLGCGARSYTQNLHYSREFAVGRAGVKAILHDYIARPDHAFDVADYGCRLDADEQRRRYIIKSILRTEGLSHHAYTRRFGSLPLDDFPDLDELIHAGYLVNDSAGLRPTRLGIDYSDMIGPHLFSSPMRTLMNQFDLH
jgi:oxygen-independent coproporphyrinogen-3 oxidase